MARRTDSQSGLTLELSGRTFHCELIPNAQNRHVRLRVLPQARPAHGAPWIHFPGLTLEPAPSGEWLPGLLPEARFCVRVTYPPRVPQYLVLETIREHTEWILAQTLQYGHVPAAALNPLGPGAKLWYRGQRVKLMFFPSAKSRPRIERVGAHLYCHLPQGSVERLPRYLEKWYRGETERLISRKLAHLAPAITARSFTYKVRTHRSRWGSCSQEGRLSFNWKLSMMPDSVMEYIMIHELAHLEQFNHSRAFWQTVRQHCPAYREAKLWLKQTARSLHG